LALTADSHGAINNLRLMAEMQWLDKFGFYESADYARKRIGPRQDYELVRCWMAHHQGMILSAICNFLTDSSLQRFFHSEPQVAANERILHEKVPNPLEVDAADELKLPVATQAEASLELCRAPVNKPRTLFAS
jgi:cyclic beta-1,2-glucan synthetase